MEEELIGVVDEDDDEETNVVKGVVFEVELAEVVGVVEVDKLPESYANN
jgi:hypothetical protein